MESYYHKLDKAIRSYEDYRPYHNYSVEWICNRIDWAWKWRKITRSEMEELSDRIVEVMRRSF